jgi:hypothetical protein
MTEKTVRPRSVLRRTMLAGTAGVLGGAVLRPTLVQSQTGTAPPAARYGDPAWWGQRKEEILAPELYDESSLREQITAPEIVDCHENALQVVPPNARRDVVPRLPYRRGDLP